jgi:ribose-phosphate pyrophosphokinase
MVIVTNLGNSEKIAKGIARRLKAKYVACKVSTFPDGDRYMRFAKNVRSSNVIVVQSFQPNPQESLLNVVFAAEAVKQLGGKKVALVAPYLSYMRQDKMFNPGECISSRVMAKLINNSFDSLVTIDPHLHRYRSMKEIFTIKATNLSSNPLIGAYVKKNIKNSVIIGPDWESYQWAEEVASIAESECTVFEKTRFSSKHVAVKMLKKVDMKGKNVVIVDDIISTGHTIAEAAKKAKALGAKSITAITVHGLFVGNALSIMKKAGVSKVVSCNTISHETNGIDVTGLLAEWLKKRR